MEPSATKSGLGRRLVFGRNPRVTLIRASVLALVFSVLFGFVLRPMRVKGLSMAPTYRDGSFNLLNRLAYRTDPPRRGDVVCIKTTGMHHLYMKRVIGLPGERVAIIDGQVMIDGEPLSEPYVMDREKWNLPEKQLGPGEFIVIGDNRQMDQRLHSWGKIRREKIVGKVLW